MEDKGARLEALLERIDWDVLRRNMRRNFAAMWRQILEERAMDKNAVIQLLEGLLEKQDIQIVHKSRCFAFGDPELPVSAGVAFVRGQINALVEADREAKAEAKAAAAE